MAYFSSIAILALSMVEPRSPSGQGNSTTYFDSVVFLTMFLLAGGSRFMYGNNITEQFFVQVDSSKHIAKLVLPIPLALLVLFVRVKLSFSYLPHLIIAVLPNIPKATTSRKVTRTRRTTRTTLTPVSLPRKLIPAYWKSEISSG